jgi:hypothetical protein
MAEVKCLGQLLMHTCNIVFIYDVFNSADCSLSCMVLNDRLISEKEIIRIWKETSVA